MGMAESVNYTVGIMVTGTAVPAGETGIRTELYHAKGHAGARVGMTMTAGTDERIDIIDQ